jgi:hypothetical protein
LRTLGEDFVGVLGATFEGYSGKGGGDEAIAGTTGGGIE